MSQGATGLRGVLSGLRSLVRSDLAGPREFWGTHWAFKGIPGVPGGLCGTSGLRSVQWGSQGLFRRRPRDSEGPRGIQGVSGV